MSQIHILDPICVSKIAAGEVIERPASVVKELLENAIDASATEIEVNIKNGGKDLIEVRDNGIGILPEDLEIAIKRHSTSKINSEQDLESISTLGFRGEALYSIASVSRFIITSRTEKDELATSVSAEGNVDNIQISKGVMASTGTIVQIRDLFYNFIVRRKFLKKSYIEQGYIYDIVAQYAIAHPDISFTFITDGKIEFRTLKGQNSLSAIKETFGKEIVNSLLDIGIVQRDEIGIEGFLSKPGHHKRNRKFQFFYLNGRRIHSKLLQSALEEGYGSYLMKREYPIAFIFIEIHPKHFDINIHPQKREVLFFDERRIRTAISSTVSYCLKTHDVVPRFTSKSSKTAKQARLSYQDFKKPIVPKSISSTDSSFKIETINVLPENRLIELPSSFSEVESVETEELSSISPKLDFLGGSVLFRGMLGKEFLIFEDLTNSDLIILDFHAAHERVKLEEFERNYKIKKISAQTFLKPFRFSIKNEQQFIVKESLNYFNALGFDIRIPKGESYLIEVHAIPKILMKSDLKKFLTELFDDLDKPIIGDHIKEIISLIACHSAYRAGESLSFHQAKELVLELSKTENPNICAHGRPTHFRITHHDMLKQVKRI
jgi:DNA mismatch repair protein MutL